MVSQSHLEIIRTGEQFRIRDLNSTNGTWLEGKRISEAELSTGKTIQLGSQGPKFMFMTEGATVGELDRTVEIPAAATEAINPASARDAGEHEQLLT